jgi:hypothetical protein
MADGPRPPADGSQAFYAVVCIATIVGMIMNFTPIRGLYWSAVINGVVAAPVMAIMMWMAAAHKILCDFTAVTAAAVPAMLAALGEGVGLCRSSWNLGVDEAVFPLKMKPGALPPQCLESFRHHSEDDHLVVDRHTPKMKSSAAVIAMKSARAQATQPVRKRKTSTDSEPHHRPGRSTTLITPSSLSRNFLYIAGASSRLAGCVTTKLGSILPSSISFRSGLV